MNLCYVNSKGEKIDLNSYPIYFKRWNLQNYRHDYSSKKGSVNEITKFERKPIKEYELIVNIQRTNKLKETLDNLYNIIEYDTIVKVPGTLYFNDQYLKCYIYGANKTTNDEVPNTLTNMLYVVTDNPVWIRKKRKEFYIGTSETATVGLDYPHDYPYDYSSARLGNATWEIDNVGDNDFELVIYGPCTDPVIYVNGWPYQVYDTLSANEHIIIKSADHTVVKYLSNGATENLFNYRGKIQSVFTKMPSGKLSLVWSGTFGFDLTIFAERSEPKWS